MSRVRVGIIDYGLCNLDSMVRAVAECGGAPFLVRWPEGLEEADHVILPGVGAFPDGVTRLQRQGLVDALGDHVVGRGIPLLGVCLGMQLLASTGSEGRQTEGSGLDSWAY